MIRLEDIAGELEGSEEFLESMKTVLREVSVNSPAVESDIARLFLKAVRLLVNVAEKRRAMGAGTMEILDHTK